MMQIGRLELDFSLISALKSSEGNIVHVQKTLKTNLCIKHSL